MTAFFDTKMDTCLLILKRKFLLFMDSENSEIESQPLFMESEKSGIKSGTRLRVPLFRDFTKQTI